MIVRHADEVAGCDRDAQAGSASAPGRRRTSRGAARRGARAGRAGQPRAASSHTGSCPSCSPRGGLRAGVAAVVARLNLPVRVDVRGGAAPAEIEASAYFAAAEALTNVVKHSHAGRAEVTAALEDGMLRIEVRDNGAGGADPDGHGLVGMRDRVTTLGGRLEIESRAGGGTLVAATLPLSAG